MSGVVDSAKKLVGDSFNFKKIGKRNLKDNWKDSQDNLKSFTSEVNATSPSSKYLGTSLMPGVKSEKEAAKDKKVTRTREAEAVAATAAERNKPIPLPSLAAEELDSKRRRAKKTGGRISTVLSDTLG